MSASDLRTIGDSVLRASLRRARRRAAHEPKAQRQKFRVVPTAKMRAQFDWLFANGKRYHIEKRRGAWEVWDLQTNKIVVTKPSEAQAQQFVEAMTQ
jgi:hypothetical protein